jgi:hypothetical protein
LSQVWQHHRTTSGASDRKCWKQIRRTTIELDDGAAAEIRLAIEKPMSFEVANKVDDVLLGRKKSVERKSNESRVAIV